MRARSKAFLRSKKARKRALPKEQTVVALSFPEELDNLRVHVLCIPGTSCASRVGAIALPYRPRCSLRPSWPTVL